MHLSVSRSYLFTLILLTVICSLNFQWDFIKEKNAFFFLFGINDLAMCLSLLPFCDSFTNSERVRWSFAFINHCISCMCTRSILRLLFAFFLRCERCSRLLLRSFSIQNFDIEIWNNYIICTLLLFTEEKIACKNIISTRDLFRLRNFLFLSVNPSDTSEFHSVFQLPMETGYLLRILLPIPK